jgi:5'-3' exonuclease
MIEEVRLYRCLSDEKTEKSEEYKDNGEKKRDESDIGNFSRSHAIYLFCFDEFHFIAGNEKANEDSSRLESKENGSREPGFEKPVKVNDLSDLFTPKTVTMKDLEGKCLAIDMNCWFEQFITTEENTNNRETKSSCIDNEHVYLNASFRQILKLLLNKIRPVFVFEEMSSSLSGAEKEMKEQILELIQVFDFPLIITSTNNITAQCGYLEQSGIVDGIITNDIISSFLYGGSLLYRNFFNNDSPSRGIEHFSLIEIEKIFKLTRNDFICLTYLLGRTSTDNPDVHGGIEGISDVTALEIVEVFYDKEKEAEKPVEQILDCLNHWKNWVTRNEDATRELTAKGDEKYVSFCLLFYFDFPVYRFLCFLEDCFYSET